MCTTDDMINLYCNNFLKSFWCKYSFKYIKLVYIKKHVLHNRTVKLFIKFGAIKKIVERYLTTTIPKTMH